MVHTNKKGKWPLQLMESDHNGKRALLENVIGKKIVFHETSSRRRIKLILFLKRSDEFPVI